MTGKSETTAREPAAGPDAAGPEAAGTAAEAAPVWLPARVHERVGAALVAPVRALAAADRPEAAGKTSSDAALVMAAVFAATHTREIVASVWIGAVESARAGIMGIIGALSRSVSMDLALLLVAALVLTVAAGKRRALGRDFDLACVAFVPYVVVKLVATLVIRAADLRVSTALEWGVAAVACGWALAVLVLAWRQTRSRGVAGALAVAREPGPGAARTRARRASLAVLVAAGLLMIHSALWIGRNLDALRPITPGDLAPMFTLRAVDADGHISAESVSLARLRGQVVIVDFWATWCGPCRDSLPAIDRVYRRHRARGLEVVSVNLDSPGQARAMLTAMDVTLPLYVDDGTVAEQYGVSTIPHLVIIDALGVVRHVHRGFEGEQALEAQVAAVLGAMQR